MPNGARKLSEGSNNSPQEMWGTIEQVATYNIGGKLHAHRLAPERNGKRAECHDGRNAEMGYEECSFHDAQRHVQRRPEARSADGARRN